MSDLNRCAEALKAKTGCTKVSAEETIKNVIDVICDELVESGSLTVVGKFAIKVVTRKGKSGFVNGKPYTSQDRKVLKITTGKKLSEALNK